MKFDAINTYVCPLCKNKLDSVSFDSVDTGIKIGALICRNENIFFPIVDYVPILLDFPTPHHTDFAAKHASQLAGLRPPHGTPRTGELDIQRTFTSEWTVLKDKETTENDLNFSFSIDEMVEFQKIHLDWPVPFGGQSRRVFEVGCGYGMESLCLRRATGAEIFGIDLNYAVLNGGPEVEETPGVHTAIASLFNPPFRPGTFDLVYSHGVLHHTYSTRDAFESILRFMAADGLVYIMVYASESAFESVLDRIQFLITQPLFRPIISRLPSPLQSVVLFPLAALYLAKFRAERRPNWQLYKLRNAMHALRDAYTPRYAHLHQFNEIMDWFEAHDLDYRFVSAKKYRDLLKRRNGAILIRGRRHEPAPAGDGM